MKSKFLYQDVDVVSLHFLYSVGPIPVPSLYVYIYTFVVSRAFMAGAASQAGDADSSRAPGLTSGLQGSVNVHRGALLLVPQWQCISSFVFYIADKGIVVRCFVCRNYDKVLMETGKLCDNIRVTKNGLVSGVDRMFKSSDSAIKHITDRLNPDKAHNCEPIVV